MNVYRTRLKHVPD